MIFLGVIGWILLSILGGVLTKNKGHGFAMGFFLSLFLSPLIGLVIGAVIKKIEPEEGKDV